MKKRSILLLLIVFLSTNLFSQTGISVPSMSSCDNIFSSFIQQYNIPGAAVAITKNGKLIYNRAFGNSNIISTEVTQPTDLFRIASVSKPITSIAIMKLLEQGQLTLDDKVFGVGGILENHSMFSSANISDSRVYNITILQLLEHSAGWDRNVNCFPNPTNPYPYYFSGCDPIVAPLHVAQQNGVSNPVKEEDYLKFMLEKGLDFTPNTKYAYSNMGYLVLGEVIEELSGMSYESFIQTEILNPLGICDMHIAGNLLEDKKEREVEYIGNGYTTLSCYGDGNYVPWEYGGLNVKAMSAHGGWISSARDLVKLICAIDGFSSKPDILNLSTINTMVTPSQNNSWYAKGWQVNTANNWWHTGALDGTATIVVRTNHQFTWAVLLNKRVIGNDANQFWSDFDGLTWNCIGSTNNYPAHDLMDLPTLNSSNLSFSNITPTSIDLSWDNGNGDKRIVVAVEEGSIKDFPEDGIDYSANNNFGFGDDISSNHFVVYNGNENSVIVNNLKPNTNYSFRVFDYNQSSVSGNYALYKLCGNQELEVQTTDNVSIGELAMNGILVHPNPTNGLLNIDIANQHAGRIIISNVLGSIIVNDVFNEGYNNELQLTQNGMYFVEFRLENGEVMIEKIVKN